MENITRRQFLKTAGIGAGAIFLGATGPVRGNSPGRAAHLHRRYLSDAGLRRPLSADHGVL